MSEETREVRIISRLSKAEELQRRKKVEFNGGPGAWEQDKATKVGQV